MIEDEQRGCAWTNALLGLRAKEIHLCGDERAFNLVANLINETGDEVKFTLLNLQLHKHEYKRLSTLKVENNIIYSYNDFKVKYSNNQNSLETVSLLSHEEGCF